MVPLGLINQQIKLQNPEKAILASKNNLNPKSNALSLIKCLRSLEVFNVIYFKFCNVLHHFWPLDYFLKPALALTDFLKVFSFARHQEQPFNGA